MDLRQDRKRRWVVPVRLGVSFALLSLLFWQLGDDVTWSTLLPDWTTDSLAWLVGAAAAMFVSYGLSTLRWDQVVRALGLDAHFTRLFSHFMAGQFISNALPSTIGGDVLRVARLAKDTGDTPASFASVVLERLTGWIALPALTLLAIAIDPSLADLGARTRVALLVAVGTLVALVVLLYAVDHDKMGGRFKDRDGWRQFAAAVHLGFGRLRGNPQGVVSVLGVALVYQFSLVAAAYMVAEALGIDATFTAIMFFIPVVLVAQVLPISIAGLGVREFLLVWLLSSIGVPEQDALALGIVLWVLTVLTSLAGAPPYAIGGGRPAHLPQEALA